VSPKSTFKYFIFAFQDLGQEFDYIFGDLTDVPVETERIKKNASKCIISRHSIYSPNQETWNFIEKILRLAFSILTPIRGKYLTHCNGKSVPLVLEKYEDLLKSIKIHKNDQNFKLKFSSSESFVPSFMEIWMFYQIQLIPESE
jgi:hypothetical protein